MRYKVYFNDTEVADFVTMKECIGYILSQTRIDKNLTPKDFKIYGLII